jgi:hypothetical protein
MTIKMIVDECDKYELPDITDTFSFTQPNTVSFLFFSHHALDIVYKLLASYIAKRICVIWNCYFIMDTIFKMYTVQWWIQQGSGHHAVLDINIVEE